MASHTPVGTLHRVVMLTGAVLLLSGWLFGSLIPVRASAEAEQAGGIVLLTEFGLQGSVKDGKWTRLRLTMTNESGRDLRGEAVFSVMVSNGGHVVDYAVPAELPKGTPIVIDLTVPGQHYNADNNRIRFVEGKWPSGKTVTMAGSKPYITASPEGAITVGVIARDPDTLNFLPILNSQGFNVKMIPLQETDLPVDTLQLDALDYLVLNDVPTGSWSAGKIEAIRSWVQRGGRLVAAGGAGYAKTAEPFRELLPVRAEGTAALDSGSNLAAIGGKPLDVSRPITVSTGKLQAGTVTLSEGGIPIAAARPYGKGEFVYAAIDPSLEPFASWPGSPDLWARLLGSSGLVPSIVNVQYMHYSSGHFDWETNELLNHFPSLQAPKLGTLVIFFAAYILLVAPALYLVLKKLDRREWAWWLIPLVSIASSIVIFAVGASDKSEALAHSIRTVELAGDGHAERTGYAAVFVPSAGQVTASFEAGTAALPFWEIGISHNGSIDAARAERIVRAAADKRTEAVWRDVPYWSVRKTMVSLGAADGYGSFEIDASYAGGMLDVEVTNGTAADLTNAAVLMNGQVYRLGDLARGESGKSIIPYSNVNPQPYIGRSMYGHQLFPFSGPGRDPYSRERGILDMYMNRQSGSTASFQPIVVGFSRDEEGWFELGGKTIPSDNVTLWSQPLHLSDSAGSGILPGTIQPSVTTNGMQSFGYNSFLNRLDLTQGSIEFEYVLPWSQTAYEAVTVYHHELMNNPNINLSVWNEAQAGWEPIAMSGAAVALPEPADTYLTAKRSIRMKLEVVGSVSYMMPAIGLEGGTS